MVLNKTLEETDDWLRLFFQPVEQELLVTRDWVEKVVLDAEKPDDVNQMLVPLLEHYPQVSSVMIADDRGREHMLLCIEQHGEQTSRQWKCRQTRRDQWYDQVQWLEWTVNQEDARRVRNESLDYDPRNRPWFQRALEKRDAVGGVPTEGDRIHWTEPYVFFTRKDLGITASVAIPPSENETVRKVVAFDVLLEDITRYTVSKRPTPNGKVLILTEEATLVGLPHDPGLQTTDQWKKAFLKEISDLDQPFARAASKVFELSPSQNIEIHSFHSDGTTWWGAAKPFQLGTQLTLWILVLVPEADLYQSLARK
jgi:hypothetical protein